MTGPILHRAAGRSPVPAGRGLRLAALLGLLLLGRAAPVRAADGGGDANRVVRDGVAVDFSISSLSRSGEEGARDRGLLEGDYAEVRFRMTDAASGKPVPGLKPAAWLDMANVVAGRGGEQKECKEKVGYYLKGVVGIRPMVDLNSYYLLVLNHDASISVIDPVVSMTGNTSLFASVPLKRPAADWTRDQGDRRLFASMPRAGEVAVVDLGTFKVTGGVAAGEAPTRLAMQPDGRALWVGNDAAEPAASGVTVIDLATLAPVGRLATGRGHHELAFSVDGRRAFVTNRQDGTVTAVDTERVTRLADLPVGGVPIAIATSRLSGQVYVAEARSGTVAVIDPARLAVVATVTVKPGVGPLRFTDDGRWGFLVNPAEHAVHVIDATTNTLAHTIALGGKPYQVSMTRGFAYLRLLDSEQVKMVNLLSLGAGRQPIVQGFGAGTGAPMAAGELSLADAITPAASEAAVFAVNPSDGNTYFYMEGMNAPMGSFGSYGHRVQAVTVVDRSLKEVSPGVYAGKLRIPVAGHYDVAFLLENPRVLHCFSTDAAPNPAMAQAPGLRAEYLDLPASLDQGRSVTFRFRLSDLRTRAARAGLTDVRVSSHAVPGRHQHRTLARDLGDGRYEAEVPLTRAGVYYLFVSVDSLGIPPSEIPFRTIQVSRDAPALAGALQEHPDASTPPSL
jgi:YVTN family beta-propeller protein